MKPILRFCGCVAIFLGGLVADMQLVKLVPINPLYEASWWKFAFAVAWAAALSVIISWHHDL